MTQGQKTLFHSHRIQPSSAGPQPQATPQIRLVGLELLRFLAALGVLVWHYQHFLFVGAERVDWLRRHGRHLDRRLMLWQPDGA